MVCSSISASVKNEIVIPRALNAKSFSSYFIYARTIGHFELSFVKYFSKAVQVRTKLKHFIGGIGLITGTTGEFFSILTTSELEVSLS